MLVAVTWKLHFLESADSSIGLPKGRLEPGPLSSLHVSPLYSQIQLSSKLRYVIHRGDFSLITGGTRLTGPQFSNISHPTKTRMTKVFQVSFYSIFFQAPNKMLKCLQTLKICSHLGVQVQHSLKDRLQWNHSPEWEQLPCDGTWGRVPSMAVLMETRLSPKL